jgi:hypothetical protein
VLKLSKPLEAFRTVKIELLDGVKTFDGAPLKPWSVTFSVGGNLKPIRVESSDLRAQAGNAVTCFASADRRLDRIITRRERCQHGFGDNPSKLRGRFRPFSDDDRHLIRLPEPVEHPCGRHPLKALVGSRRGFDRCAGIAGPP